MGGPEEIRQLIEKKYQSAHTEWQRITLKQINWNQGQTRAINPAKHRG
jgi:hypothetical protein